MMQICVTVLTKLAVVLIFLPMTQSVAQEIAFFRLTDFSAFLESQYRFTVSENQSTGGETIIEDFKRNTELALSTRSYVFHPNLLDINLSGGILVDQQDINREQTSFNVNRTTDSSSDTLGVLWNINASLQFLKKKPYPVTLSYFRENPVIQTGIEGSFTQKTESYGIDMRLINLLPVNLSLNANRYISSGKSLDRVVDSTYDRVSLNARKLFPGGERISLKYDLSRQNSRNGDPRRDIQETQRLSHRATITSSLTLGSRDQFSFSENASINLRNNPEVIDFNFAPYLRWTHSPKLESTYRYNYFQSERNESMLNSTSQLASASLRYSPTSRIYGIFSIKGDESKETNGFKQDSYGASILGNYSGSIFSGNLNLSAGLDYNRKDRQATAKQVRVREESLQLAGLMPVTLAKEFVIANSVVVRNETDTQTFIEDVDYRLIEIGSQTQLERLIGGSILDGEMVLVDYDIETGGTFAYSLLGQTFSANLNLARYYNLYVRYRGNIQSVESGIPTTPLNSVKAVEIGTQVNLPLRWWGINVGGDAKYIYHDEDISPYNQTSINVYAQVPLPYRISLRGTVQHSRTDNLNSNEDKNVIGFMGNLNWRARRNLTITAEGFYDKDDGGTIDRSRTEMTLRASWRYRRINVSAEAKYQQQIQGEFKYDDTRLWLVVRRELF